MITKLYHKFGVWGCKIFVGRAVNPFYKTVSPSIMWQSLMMANRAKWPPRWGSKKTNQQEHLQQNIMACSIIAAEQILKYDASNLGALPDIFLASDSVHQLFAGTHHYDCGPLCCHQLCSSYQGITIRLN